MVRNASAILLLKPMLLNLQPEKQTGISESNINIPKVTIEFSVIKSGVNVETISTERDFKEADQILFHHP